MRNEARGKGVACPGPPSQELRLCSAHPRLPRASRSCSNPTPSRKPSLYNNNEPTLCTIRYFTHVSFATFSQHLLSARRLPGTLLGTTVGRGRPGSCSRVAHSLMREAEANQTTWQMNVQPPTVRSTMTRYDKETGLVGDEGGRPP